MSSMCSPNWLETIPWLSDMLFVNTTLVKERPISSRQAHKASRAVPRIGNTPIHRPFFFCTLDRSKLTWSGVDNRALFTSSRNWRRRHQSWRESVRRLSFLSHKYRCRIASDRLWHSLLFFLAGYLVQQSVKDVLQSLVDDGLVTVEKIGTSNYYWSFPSDMQQKVTLQGTKQSVSVPFLLFTCRGLLTLISLFAPPF